MPAGLRPIILSVGDRIEAGEYLLHSRFRRSANYLGEQGMLSLVSASIGEGPFNIVLDPFPVRAGRRLAISRDAIETDAGRLARFRDRVYDSRPLIPAPEPDNLPERLRRFRRALMEASPERSLAFLVDPRRERRLTTGLEKAFLARIKRGVEMLLAGKLEEGAKTLKGTGFGLTPSGDDFLAGVLVGLHLHQRLSGGDSSRIRDRIWITARSANPLVNLFLTMARDFRLPRRLKELAESLGGNQPGAVYRRASLWLRQGETSPSDLAVGTFFALTQGGRLCS